MAGAPGFQGLADQPNEFGADAFLHQQTATGGADFALVEGNGAGGFGGGFFQVRGIRKHDVGALAAGLQPHPFHVGLAGVDHQLLGHVGGTGEHQAVHVHVQGQGLTHGMAETGEYVEHAVGYAGFGGQCRQANGCERRFFRGFEDH